MSDIVLHRQNYGLNKQQDRYRILYIICQLKAHYVSCEFLIQLLLSGNQGLLLQLGKTLDTVVP
jgi:hypothetical protein